MQIIDICRVLLFCLMLYLSGNQAGNVYRTKTDWIVDRNHQLDYPIGVDTVVWWEKGRYQIVYDTLFDESLKWPDYILMEDLEGYYRVDDKIFFWGNGQYGVLDVVNDDFSWCSEDEMPKDYRTHGYWLPSFTPPTSP